MSLAYALVARGNVILVDHSERRGGNFFTVTQTFLDKFHGKKRSNDSWASFAGDNYVIHCKFEEGLTYLCLADPNFPQERAFSFLSAVANEFSPLKTRAKSANAYGLRLDFEDRLQLQMRVSESNQSSGKEGGSGRFAQSDQLLARAQAEADAVKGVMVQNIEKVLERDEKLNVLMDSAEELEESSYVFQSRAQRLHRQMWWQNLRMKILLVLVLLAIILVIVLSAVCGGGGC